MQHLAWKPQNPGINAEASGHEQSAKITSIASARPDCINYPEEQFVLSHHKKKKKKWTGTARGATTHSPKCPLGLQTQQIQIGLSGVERVDPWMPSGSAVGRRRFTVCATTTFGCVSRVKNTLVSARAHHFPLQRHNVAMISVINLISRWFERQILVIILCLSLSETRTLSLCIGWMANPCSVVSTNTRRFKQIFLKRWSASARIRLAFC